jgi:hypothetical protein
VVSVILVWQATQVPEAAKCVPASIERSSPSNGRTAVGAVVVVGGAAVVVVLLEVVVVASEVGTAGAVVVGSVDVVQAVKIVSTATSRMFNR